MTLPERSGMSRSGSNAFADIANCERHPRVEFVKVASTSRPGDGYVGSDFVGLVFVVRLRTTARTWHLPSLAKLLMCSKQWNGNLCN